ncbi:plakophilin-2 [Solea senegalensis]|uniref:Plakophilin-2 n=1 Tax=Solea senegalensis TaxID=28829 RepID=A0AAV6QT61_SOLSE|nr:plakophilin-2 [Solea senegalensis]KAG7496128.1 plakophilin-2 [Solea senegalensis]
MDEVFLKSALPAAADSFMLNDTSLAVPAELTDRSSAKPDSNDRSLRVHQQVQLTLARKAKRTLSNGGVHLQRNTAQSFDAADGLLPNTKVNGFTFTNRSLSNSRVRRPSRRVEVSPPPSPGFPRSRFNYSTLRFGTYTHPGPTQPQMTGTLHDRTFASDSFLRYAFSEAPRGTRPHASTPTHGSFRQRSLRQTAAAAPPPVFANKAFQRSGGDYGSHLSHNRTSFKQERSGDVMLGAVQPDEGLSWLTHVRRNAHGLHRLNSYPPSVTSVDADVSRQMELELPFQQIHRQNVANLKSENKLPEMTLERAVSLLTQEDEETLLYAASHIQNQCFKSTEAKKMVYYLRGIGKLLQLLHVDHEEVQRVAAGALRNVVYQSSENKMEVKENNGLATILGALKSSRDVETRRQLTGLLWNLSSHDLLKERLSKDALSVLTKSVLVPSSGISEGENPKDELLADDEVFHHATGCLRNLSSAGPDGRKAMRHCENLIDSLVYYIRGTIADYKTDDKSTENCVCILHNLSYQFEAELPKKYMQDLRESRQNLASDPKSVSCFPNRSAKITEHLERQSPLLEEKANPSGIEWLWSAITIRMYLSLIARSVRHYTQEAAVGALQNITAGKGAVSEAIAFTIVQRENGLQHIRKILREGESDVKRTTISLIKNLSRHEELHPDIVKQVLPELVPLLPNDDTGTDLPSESTACLCHILTYLSQSNSQHVRAVVNHGALPKIINISSKDNGYGPTRAGQAACVLLHTMWRHNDLHGAYKKCGLRKTDFINPRTTKAVNSGRN